jgi:hypothetical protein
MSNHIEPIEYVVDVKIKVFQVDMHSSYIYDIKIDTNGNVNITRCNAFSSVKKHSHTYVPTSIYSNIYSISDNIPIPKYLIEVIMLELRHLVNSPSPLDSVLREVNVIKQIKTGVKEENIIIANKNEIYEKQINGLQEYNKNLSEENIIIANKNEIYKKHLNELQESVERLYKLLFFLLLTLSIVPLICLRYFCE